MRNFGRMLAAVLVVAAVAGGPAALAQTAGTIEGKVVNGTEDGPVGGIDVALQLFSQQGDLGVLRSTTDDGGRFVFEDLPSGVAGYQVSATFESADYRNPAQAYTPGQTRQEVVTVYEPTTDPGAVTLTDYIVWVDRIGSGVAVQHDFAWDNSGSSAYVGEDGVVVSVPLPKDATNLQYLGTFLENPGEIGGGAFVSDAPIVPGTTTATLRYEAPPISQLTLEMAFATSRLQLFVPDNVEVQANALRLSGTNTDRDPITNEERTYNVYVVQDVAAGTTIEVSMSQTEGGSSANTALWILLIAAAVGAIVIGAALLVGRRRRTRTKAHRGNARTSVPAAKTKPAPVESNGQRTRPATAPATSGGSDDLDEDAELLIEEIAALDLSFERGLLDERTYKRLRVAAKDRLLRAEEARTRTGAPDERGR